jgi:cytochrome P450
MVIDEALRLFPPAWVISRTAVEEDEVSGFRIPRGSSVYASAWVTHRSPRYWENPEAFDPERFSPARSGGRPLYAYYPFGGGPRSCIGERLSLVELSLALAMTAQRFRLTVNHIVVPEALFTLHPRGGVHAVISYQ